MTALDHAGESLAVDAAREQLRKQAKSMGMRLVSFTVTEKPIPDPSLEALPRADHERIAVISRDMRTRPQEHLAELKRLVAKYPHIPMLRNHFAGALEAAGQRGRAAEVVAETAREFPTYFFAFCNHVMLLVAEGKIEEARTLVEGGPRGPVFTLTDFDPTRETFHISEAISHAAMVGHYMLATGRLDAAKVQLEMLQETAPNSPQFRSLARAMGQTHDDLVGLSAALLRMAADHQRRSERRKARAEKKPGRTTRAKPQSDAGIPKVRAPHSSATSGDAGAGLFQA